MKKCSFCGLMKDDSEIIEGLEANICLECLETEQMNRREEPTKPMLKPHEMKRELDKYVIAQEDAKKKLCVEVYNHYKRISIHKKMWNFQRPISFSLDLLDLGKPIFWNDYLKFYKSQW